MNRYLFLAIAIFFLTGKKTFGQEYPKGPEVQSPQAYELKKHIDFPVSLSNGIASINIPLYEINYSGYKLPLVLKYHGSGVNSRLYDTYGLNWSLHGIGFISRSVNGAEDEFNSFEKNFWSSGYYDILTYLSGGRGGGDMEYDEFSVSLPNSDSFSFYIEKETDGTYLFHTRPVRNDVKIQMQINVNNNIDSFTITDKMGVRYFFADTERCQTSSSQTSFYRNGWKITSILLPDSKKEINFEYFNGWDITRSTSSSRKISDKGFCLVDVEGNNSCNASHFLDDVVLTEDGAPEIIDLVLQYSTTDYFVKNIKKITFGNDSINFNYKPLDEQYEREHNIESITIENINKKIKFHGDRINDKYFRLDAISTVAMTDESEIMDYKFSYNPISINKYPKVDCFGNVKGFGSAEEENPININNHSALTYTVPSLMIKLEGYSKNYETSISSITDAPQRVQIGGGDGNIPSGDSGLLNRIDYATGGYMTYEYEQNQYKRTVDHEYYRSGDVVNGGAVRVKKIAKYDSGGELLLTRNYKYGVDECGYGIAPVEVTPVNFQRTYEHYPSRYECFRVGDLSHCESCGAEHFHSYTISMRVREYSIGNFMQKLDGKPPVIYEQVTEYYGDETDNVGKNIYHYKHSFEEEDGSGMHVGALTLNGLGDMVRTESASSSYGQLLVKEVFGYENQEYKLKEKTVNEWEWDSGNVLHQMKDHYIYKLHVQNECDWANYYGLECTSFITMLDKADIKRTTTTSYLDGDSLIKIVDYKYDNYGFIYRIDETTSDNTLITTENTYPYSYVEEPYSSMVNANIIAPIIEIQKSKDGKLLETTSVGYRNWGMNGIYKPDTVKQMIGTAHEKVIVTYEFDPDNGNLQSITSVDQVDNSYYWAYDQQYPVVKAVNAEYDNASNIDLKGAVESATKSHNSISYSTLDEFLTALGKFEQVDGSLDQNKIASWKIFMDDVKAVLPDAMFSFYTYAPLIGMTSQTDPNGITTYYEYDDFGRLKCTKDSNGDILQMYDYNYKELPSESEDPSTLSLSSTSLIFDSSGTAQTVNITSNTSWSASGSPGFVQVSPSSGNGDGVLSISCDPNSGDSRAGTVTVTGGSSPQTISISQAGAAAPYLNVSTTDMVLEGMDSFSISSNIEWSLSVSVNGSDWVTASPTSGSGDKNIVLSFIQSPSSMPSGSYSATVIVVGGGITKTVSLSYQK